MQGQGLQKLHLTQCQGSLMPLPCYTTLTPVNPKPKLDVSSLSMDVDFDCHGGYHQL